MSHDNQLDKYMNNRYAIHEDFQKFPSITFNFHPLLMTSFNTVMRAVRYWQCCKADDRLTTDVHRLRSADGDTFKTLVIKPKGLKKSAPALLYYHGGAFAITYAGLHIKSCERYALETGCCVIFVDYRLSPKYPFPCAFDDCNAALDWTISHAEDLGIDIQRIAVMGDSAGGALAASVAQKALDKQVPLVAQLLIYPALDSECKTESARKYTDVPVWNATSNVRMWDMYLKNFHDGPPPPYASPSQRGELKGLPEAYIETAEFDPLCDEGVNYAQALRQAEVSVVLNETKGSIHGYDTVTNSSITKASVERRIAFMKKVFTES